MNPIIIIINGVSVQLGSPLPDKITDFSVTLNSMFPLTVDIATSGSIKLWLNQVIDRLDTDYVLYNNTLIPTQELVQF